jgi:hypothetical protein
MMLVLHSAGISWCSPQQQVVVAAVKAEFTLSVHHLPAFALTIFCSPSEV